MIEEEANVLGRFFERGKLPIGVDFGARFVRAAQVAWAGDRWRVTAAGARALPADLPADGADRLKGQAEALIHILESGRFSGRKVVSALPSSVVQYKNLRLPPMPPSELRTAVEWEAADRLKLGHNYQVDYFDAGEVRQGEELRQEVILLAAPASAIEEHVAMLIECGLEPAAIDATPGALARWAASGSADAEEVRLVLDLGASGSNVLICRHGRVMFFKRLELGGRQIEDAIAKQMNIPLTEACQIVAQRAGDQSSEAPLVGSTRREGAAQAINDAVRPVLTDLAREVGLCLRYHSVTFRGHRPQVGIVTGGGAVDPLLPQVLAQETALALRSAEAAVPVDWSQVDPSVLALSPATAWPAALGLALRTERAHALRGAA